MTRILMIAAMFASMLAGAAPALAHQGGPNHGGNPFHDPGPPSWGKIGQNRQHESRGH